MRPRSAGRRTRDKITQVRTGEATLAHSLALGTARRCVCMRQLIIDGSLGSGFHRAAAIEFA